MARRKLLVNCFPNEILQLPQMEHLRDVQCSQPSRTSDREISTIASIIAVLSIIWTSTQAPKFMWELKLLFCFHTGTFIDASFEASADTAQIPSSLDTDIQLFSHFMTKAAQFPMTTASIPVPRVPRVPRLRPPLPREYAWV